MSRNNEVLTKMFEIYGIQSVDWMGYEIKRKEELTYHHIDEQRSDGETTIENGAILSGVAHQKLHIIEKYDHELYEQYRYMFRIINDMHCPPTEEVMQIMGKMKQRTEYLLSNKSTAKSKQMKESRERYLQSKKGKKSKNA